MNMITVVVPAYNSEDTISRCINSILNQTYQDIQLIVVDDGSKDGTKKTIEELKKIDSRIELISIPNSGVSHARNVGIEKARGDYITFVDSDDYIDETMYESLIKLIKDYNVDIAHCSYKNVNEDGTIIKRIGYSGKIISQTHDEAIECFLTDRLFVESLCNKLYARHLFDNVRLDESIRINEDVLANFCLFNVAKNSVYVDEPFYSYVSNTQSVTHTKRGYEGAEQSLNVMRQIYQLSLGKSYEKYAKNKLAQRMLTLYKDYINYDEHEVVLKRKKLRTEIKQNKRYLNRRNDKIAYYLVLYCPPLYKIVYNNYSKRREKLLDPLYIGDL